MIEDLKNEIRELSEVVERLDKSVRGDGDQNLGLAARVANLERLASRLELINNTAIGAIVVGILSLIGSLIMLGAQHLNSGASK